MSMCRATSCSKARSDWLATNSRTNAMSLLITIYTWTATQKENGLFPNFLVHLFRVVRGEIQTSKYANHANGLVTDEVDCCSVQPRSLRILPPSFPSPE